jgi:hypothetical protein
MNERDADRLKLLDRIADRVPELDLEQQSVEWTTLDDGHEALLVNGGGIDGGADAFFVNYRDAVHAYGSLDPIVPGHVGCIVIRPDGNVWEVDDLQGIVWIKRGKSSHEKPLPRSIAPYNPRGCAERSTRPGEARRMCLGSAR